MAKVCVPLAAGFEEMEAVALIDVMRRGGIEVVVAGVNEELVTGANGITVKADTDIKYVVADELDMVVLPGGWGGTHVLAENETVQELLRTMKAKEKMIGAICAAPFALKTAGVLGEHYTCYPSVEEQIGNLEGYTDKQKVVVDGNVMTSRGPGTAICFGLAIVRKLVGEETYQALREGLLADYC
ncbi:DJ-1 family glyoxalase III [Hydrogenimonas sp.]